MTVSRRTILTTALESAAGLVAAARAARGGERARQWRISLSTGMLGVRADFAESIRLAAQYGFEAVEPSLTELESLPQGEIGRLADELRSRKLAVGAPGMSVPVGQPQEKFSAWALALPKYAAALERLGGTRFMTWILSAEASLTYLENFRLHARRLREVAAILGDHGIRLGLEYLGPKTIWSSRRYPFIHSMREMKELIAEIGQPNVGLLLDSWHWYTAGDTPADLLTLGNRDIVGVHLNDAPAGIPVDQQIDNRRALPASTGVIDAGGFLRALEQVGYDGPVAAEPFDAELRKLAPEEAVARAIQAMRKAMALAPQG